MTGQGVETRQQPVRPAEDRDRQTAPIRARVGVAADDRNAIGRGPGLESCQDRCGQGLVGRPERVDDRDGPPAHGRDVAEIDHDAAIAGEPRVGCDEAVDEAFDCEEQEAVPVRNGGAIVPDRDGLARNAEPAAGREAEGFDRSRDIAFAVEAAARADQGREIPQGSVHRHAASLVTAVMPAIGSPSGG